MKMGIRRQRLVFLALLLALLASLALVGGSTLAVVDQEMLTNGNFEDGFSQIAGCGSVGLGWGCFTNGGSIEYGFYDDQWAPVVADGAHSQLMELNTKQFAASEPDRFAGIYQSVHLVHGGTYQLSLHGLMREHEPNPAEDAFRYRVQWGYTTNGSTDWSTVTNWAELPWDKIDNRLSPTGMESYSTSFVAPSPTMTIFFRVWKKWGTPGRELDVNLDAISLFGPGPQNPPLPAPPIVILPGPIELPTHPIVLPDNSIPIEPSAAVACVGPNQIQNGSFENGFTQGVGNHWSAYTSGGAATYGFYDEMWPRVITDGAHGQLIEINTWGLAASDPDRLAGISQVVHGLNPRATYEFALTGLLREEAAHPGEDPFRYRVQWGYAAADADPSQADITNWVEIPWDEIYLRTDPGPMLTYSVRIKPPSENVIIGIRAWKKWGTVHRELNVNLDAIRLSGCPGGVQPTWPPTHPEPKPLPACVYVVAPGDTLGKIAAHYHISVQALAQANQIANSNVIYVGQKLIVPCEGAALPPPVMIVKPNSPAKPVVVVVEKPVVVVEKPAAPPPAPETPVCSAWHIVVQGNTLNKIAAKYGTSVTALTQANSLANPNVIYVGQKLCIAN